MVKLLLLLPLFCCFSLLPPVYSQESDSGVKARAKELFYHAKYADALSILSRSPRHSREDNETSLLVAMCNYHLNRLEKASARLTALIEEDRSPFPECWLYQGKIFHAQHRFAEAADYYKVYLKIIKNDHPHRKMIRDAVRRCSNGIELEYKQTATIVENLGREVNTAYDEFAPLPSPNFDDKLYFSSIRQGNMGGMRNNYGAMDERLGHYSGDMYYCSIHNGIWSQTQALHFLLNSPRHEVLLDFNADGSVLYYFKGLDINSGDILLDTFKQVEERSLSSNPFQGPLNGRAGDGTPHFTGDTLVFFSSRRPGGYGGLDIYKTSFKNGSWSPAENLGPHINSPYDETTPFLARDGRSLFFSSNDSRKSIGGLDVFKSVYNAKARRWTQPISLGLPVNSAADDAYFRLANDGFTAFLSSSRKDGYGKRDLYIVYFQDFLTEMEFPATLVNFQPLPVRETTSLPEEHFDEEPPAVDYPVLSEESENAFGPIFFSSEEKLLGSANLAMLDDIADLMQQYSQLSLIISAYASRELPVGERLFRAVRSAEKAAAYLLRKGVSPAAVYIRGLSSEWNNPSASGRQCLEFSFSGTSTLPPGMAVPVIGKGFVSIAPGDIAANSGLFYKVQIASLKGKFNGSLIRDYPGAMVETVSGLDYYRYTLGAFATYAAAEQLRRKLIRKAPGAFVVSYINGKRAD